MTACPFKLTKSGEVWWPSVSAVILLTLQKIITHHLSPLVSMHPVIHLYFSPHSKARHLRLHACMLQKVAEKQYCWAAEFTQNCLRLKEDLMKTKLSPSVSLGCLQNAEYFLIPLCFLTWPTTQLHWEGNLPESDRERGKKNLPFFIYMF